MADKILFIGFFEELALMVNAGTVRIELATYMAFGTLAYGTGISSPPWRIGGATIETPAPQRDV